eukprot:239242-Prymnesium_polylepis.4
MRHHVALSVPARCVRGRYCRVRMRCASCECTQTPRRACTGAIPVQEARLSYVHARYVIARSLQHARGA